MTVQTIAEPFAETSAGLDAGECDQDSGDDCLARGACITVGGRHGRRAQVRLRGWLSVRAALRASTPTTLPGVDSRVNVRATPGLLEPGVVGLWRPTLLLPVGVERQAPERPDQLRSGHRAPNHASHSTARQPHVVAAHDRRSRCSGSIRSCGGWARGSSTSASARVTNTSSRVAPQQMHTRKASSISVSAMSSRQSRAWLVSRGAG